MTTVCHLEPDQSAQISRLGGPPGLMRRLVALGLRPGAAIRLVRRAPLGGAFQIALGDSFIALRAQEAGQIHLELS
ncbi:MAG: hypothetical protein AMXMBFR33_73650 [Candidatus Xenobia bacterium]